MLVTHEDVRYIGGKAGTAIAMGYFDGVHLGHQAVIEAALQTARQKGLSPAVFTFMQDGATPRKGKSLMARRQKHAVLEQLGVECCFEPEFSSFQNLSPEEFFQQLLLDRFHAKALFCGENIFFGKNKAGNVDTLRRLCKAAGVALQVVPTTQWRGAPVSSSRIRAALQAGDIPAVNAMLGRPYEICFEVKSGRQLGREHGFPTINQHFPEWMQPPAQGVYVTGVVLGGKVWPAATGYGTRPTVGGKGATCETFIPGFSGDLYGSRVRVRFFEQIAPTQKFETPQLLAQAVQGWAAKAEAYFAARGG